MSVLAPNRPQLRVPGVRASLVGLLALSVALGPIAARLWGSGNVAQSTVLALIVLAGIGFYFGEPRRMWSFLTPVWLIHAGLVIFDGLTAWGYRADGLAGNPNVAAGFLVLGILFLVMSAKPTARGTPTPTRESLFGRAVASARRAPVGPHLLLALPLLVALPFTQSRLAIAVLLVMIVVQAAPHVRKVIIATVVGIATIWITASPMMADRLHPETVVNDVAARFPILRIPRLWPVGHIDDSDLSSWNTPRVKTMHNVPVKLATELGIGAGLAWVLLTSTALAKSRQRRSEKGNDAEYQHKSLPILDCHFYMLLAVALLSMLDFYPFTVMGWAWWALIALPRRSYCGAP